MLPKQLRLGKAEFKELSLKKPDQTIFFPLFSVKYYKNNSSRFSVIVSKRNLQKASSRNLIKRRVKSLINKHLDTLNPGYYLFIAKKNSLADYTYENINAFFNSLLPKISKFR